MADKIDIQELVKAFQEANQDDTPIAVQTPSGNSVIGDTVKQGTIEPQSYEMTFWLPVVNGEAPAGAELVMDGKAYVQKVVAKEKFITAKIGRHVRSYASKVAITFTKFKDQGDSEIYTVDDLLEIYSLFDDDTIEACENMIVAVLGISNELVQYITTESLIETCAKLIANNPSFFQID